MQLHTFFSSFSTCIRFKTQILTYKVKKGTPSTWRHFICRAAPCWLPTSGIARLYPPSLYVQGRHSSRLSSGPQGMEWTSIYASIFSTTCRTQCRRDRGACHRGLWAQAGGHPGWGAHPLQGTITLYTKLPKSLQCMSPQSTERTCKLFVYRVEVGIEGRRANH